MNKTIALKRIVMCNRTNNRYGAIYLIHCIPENKDYIGQTRRSFNRRWREHCQAVERYSGSKHNISLIDWKIAEYGEDAFTINRQKAPTSGARSGPSGEMNAANRNGSHHEITAKTNRNFL